MKIITTDKIAASNGPYSQGYTHNGFFFTAGQIGVEPSDGELHVHTIEEQTDRATGPAVISASCWKLPVLLLTKLSKPTALLLTWMILTLLTRYMQNTLFQNRPGPASL